MQPKPIVSPEDYAEAVARIEALIALNPVEGTPEAKELDQWGEYVAAYEEVHFQL